MWCGPTINDDATACAPSQSELGRWKSTAVYYHLAYLGGNLTKQLTHTVGPETVADEFDKIVKSGATEYMLVNMSEVREYIMCGRMIADITWDAPAIFAQPNAAARYTAWWGAASTSGASTAAAEAAYNKYFALLNVPDKLWIAPNVIEDLLYRLYRKVSGESYAPLNSEIVAPLQTVKGPLDDAFRRATTRAETAMSLSQRRCLSRRRSTRPAGGPTADGRRRW